MNWKHGAVFAAGAVVGAATAFPAFSHATYWAEFQPGDNLADNSMMPRYEMLWANVRYDDPFSVSNGSNVGVRGCSHGYYAFVESCGAWTYAPPTPVPATPSNAIVTLPLSWENVTKVRDINTFCYFDYLRMGAAASATSVRIKSTWYGNM